MRMTELCSGWKQWLLIYYARVAAAKLISLIVCSAKQSNCRRSPQRLSTTAARRFLCFYALSLLSERRAHCAQGVCALKTQAAKQCRWPLRHHSMRGARCTENTEGKQHNEIHALVSNFLFIGWQLSRQIDPPSYAGSNLYFIHAEKSHNLTGT